MRPQRFSWLFTALSFVVVSSLGQAATWTSSATGGSITATVTEPNPVVSPPALVVYLKNLSCERIGQEADSTILADFVANGCRVVQLDYAKHAQATAPFLNADVLKIRNDIGSGTFPGSSGLVTSKNKCYILCEGYRLLRNVPYYLNDRTVYNGAETTNVELRMDIAYPSQPSRAVPIVLEYSCSNSYFGNADDRMNNANAFTGITDTILEGAPAAGIAWAMADHPKFQQWGLPKSGGFYSPSFELNPDTIRKVRSSVRVLREVGATLGLSGNVALHGFSRGASAASLGIGDRADPTIDTAGYSTALSSRANAVLLGSGIYDYSHSGGTTTGDPAGTAVDIYSRYVTAWGATASNLPLWDSQGAPYYMVTTASSPVFLSYNTDDAAWYVYQAQLLATKLAALGVPYQIVTGTGAHHVTTTGSTLTQIYNFFKTHSKAQPAPPGTTVLSNYDLVNQRLDLRINANGNAATVLYAVATNATPRQWVQANGSVGTAPVWRSLADWGTVMRVGPITDVAAARFTVVAYDPTNATTALTQANTVAPAEPQQIGGLALESGTGAISFSWPAPVGVADPSGVPEIVQRSATLGNDWATVPGAILSVANGIVTFRDPAPTQPASFYRLTIPTAAKGAPLAVPGN